jgi:hypothetical protein
MYSHVECRTRRPKKMSLFNIWTSVTCRKGGGVGKTLCLLHLTQSRRCDLKIIFLFNFTMIYVLSCKCISPACDCCPGLLCVSSLFKRIKQKKKYILAQFSCCGKAGICGLYLGPGSRVTNAGVRPPCHSSHSSHLSGGHWCCGVITSSTTALIINRYLCNRSFNLD